MSDKPTIPQEVKDKIHRIPWDYNIYQAAYFGYGLGYSIAQQELAAKDNSIEILRIERDNYFESNSRRMKELAEAKKEIERLKGLIENIVRQTRSIYPKISDPEKAWQQFKTENNL